MEMCLENTDFSLGRCLVMHHKQGALDMKSYVPTPLPHGHQGALSQTQPGHAVHPTSTPLFWVSAVHPALYDWMALPTNRIGLKKNKIKKHHPWWLGNQSVWKPYPQNIILELVRDHSGQLFLGRALEKSGSSRLYTSLLKLKSELWWKLQGKQFLPNMLWDITELCSLLSLIEKEAWRRKGTLWSHGSIQCWAPRASCGLLLLHRAPLTFLSTLFLSLDQAVLKYVFFPVSWNHMFLRFFFSPPLLR